MSRTRIVKGKITERVKGDISIYSASNIIETSLQSIVETGKEKGISFGQPSKPPEYQPENTIILYPRPDLGSIPKQIEISSEDIEYLHKVSDWEINLVFLV